MFIDGHRSSKMFGNDLLCFFSQSFDLAFVKVDRKVELMKKLSFNVGGRVMLDQRACFRKVGIITGYRKVGVEIHGVIDDFDSRNGESRGRWGSDERHCEC